MKTTQHTPAILIIRPIKTAKIFDQITYLTSLESYLTPKNPILCFQQIKDPPLLRSHLVNKWGDAAQVNRSARGKYFFDCEHPQYLQN